MRDPASDPAETALRTGRLPAYRARVMRPRGHRTIAIALAAAALLAAALLHPGLAAGVLHLAPALALLALLVLGHYVGERTIARIAAARTGRRRRRRLPAASRLRPLARALARGGDLLGAALAVRPPPAGLAAR
jgi:hypothetical protein